MNINQSFLVLLISAAVLNGTPLLFGTVGEIPVSYTHLTLPTNSRV